MSSPAILMPQPGIQRDGTKLSAEAWTDGQWARFVNGRPRKMLGMSSVSDAVDGPARGLEAHSESGRTYLHVGTQNALQTLSFDPAGVSTSPVARALPAAPVAGALWKFDIRNNPVTAGNDAYLIAHAGQNLNNIDSQTNTPIYWGKAAGTGAMTVLNNAPQVSGGVVVLHPFVFAYGNAGTIAYCDANQPEVWTGGFSNTVNISSQKIVHGARTRGGGQSPAGLFWSLDSVIRATFTGGTVGFAFDHVTNQSSIMSSRSVAEYDGLFMWPGVDRFLTFNGGVKEIANTFSTDWFFDNINRKHRQKVFSFVNARWGEIWWCFPFGDATECTHALIYNVREGVFYDTALVGGSRSAAVSSSLLGFPVLGGTDVNVHGSCNLWRHETGLDIVDGGKTSPIRSYIQSNYLTQLRSDKPSNNSLVVSSMEPDIIQKGDISLTVSGRANARSAEVETRRSIIGEAPAKEGDQIASLRADMRQMSFRFESDEVGGYWQLGENFVNIDAGGDRRVG